MLCEYVCNSIKQMIVPRLRILKLKETETFIKRAGRSRSRRVCIVIFRNFIHGYYCASRYVILS